MINCYFRVFRVSCSKYVKRAHATANATATATATACMCVYIDMFIAISNLAGSGSQVYMCKAEGKQREGGEEEG
jgi:hypothetical protein